MLAKLLCLFLLVSCSPSVLELENRAGVLATVGRFPEAIELHKRALERSEGEEALLIKNNLAAALYLAGDLPEAERLYRECLADGYERAKPRLGFCLADQGKHLEALNYLTDDLYIASCLSALEFHEEAEDILEALCKRDRSPINLYNWAVELENTGHDAQLLYKEAIRMAVGDEEFIPLAKDALSSYN